jgi:hypothetical protein
MGPVSLVGSSAGGLVVMAPSVRQMRACAWPGMYW